MSILFGRVESVSNELTQLQDEMKRIEAKRKQEREEKLKQQNKHKSTNSEQIENRSDRTQQKSSSDKLQSQESTDSEYIMVNAPTSSVINSKISNNLSIFNMKIINKTKNNCDTIHSVLFLFSCFFYYSQFIPVFTLTLPSPSPSQSNGGAEIQKKNQMEISQPMMILKRNEFK